MDDHLLKETDAARFLGRSVSSMRLDRARRQGPAFYRIGRRSVRYRLADLIKYRETGRVETSIR